VGQNYGHYYGTASADVEGALEAGVDVMLDIEPRGARHVKERYPDSVLVYILPPDLTELKQRLCKRGFERPEVIETRFNQAVEEMHALEWYDYVVINDELKEAVGCLKAIYVAEKHRRMRMEKTIRAFLSRYVTST